MAGEGQSVEGGRAGAATIDDSVGRRLRREREARGITLRELARRLEISPSAVSQFETGKALPSVSTLWNMVNELGISLDELFSGLGDDTRQPEAGQGAAARAGDSGPESRHVQRAGSRVTIELESGVRWERLTPQSEPDADFIAVTYDVGGSSSRGDRFVRHEGREFGLVLSGRLEVTVGFDRYELGPGDSIAFDSNVPHCLRNVGDEPVHGVWFVVGRQGDHRVAPSQLRR